MKELAEYTTEELMEITNYDFDLDDQNFISYFRGRTGYVITNRILHFLRMDEQEYMTTDDLIYPKTGERVPDEDRVDLWKAQRLTKGKLQVCYDFYFNKMLGL